MRCHYRIFNTRNIRETIDTVARDPYYHLFNQYVFILLTKMRTETKTVPSTIHYFHSKSNTFTIDNLISFICPVVSHFSWNAVKYTLKQGRKANISHSKRRFHFTNRSLRIPYYFVEIWTPLKPKNKNDALIGARYIPLCGDLIGASNIPVSVR